MEDNGLRVRQTESKPFSMLLVLCLMTGIFYLIRWGHAGRPLNFLLWNGALALLPLFLSGLALRYVSKGRFFLFFLLWLFFFPNGPYIVTDLMHVRTTHASNLWIDLLLLSTAAATGLAASVLSLRFMQEAIMKRRGALFSWVFVGVLSILAGFGVYLGRFLRWNTWDVLLRPESLFKDVWAACGNPEAQSFTLLFAVLLGGTYAVFSLLSPLPESPSPMAKKA